MVEMELSKIVIDEKRHDQIIVLKEKNGSRLLPIVIGLNEASAIKLEISGFKPPRPLTHDLLFTTIENLDASIDKIIIDKFVVQRPGNAVDVKTEQSEQITYDFKIAVMAGNKQ